MEAEIISMTYDLFGGKSTPKGVVTSGGTESICMAILGHREWAKKFKKITEPELVFPRTAHAAFWKACF